MKLVEVKKRKINIVVLIVSFIILISFLGFIENTKYVHTIKMLSIFLTFPLYAFYIGKENEKKIENKVNILNLVTMHGILFIAMFIVSKNIKYELLNFNTIIEVLWLPFIWQLLNNIYFKVKDKISLDMFSLGIITIVVLFFEDNQLSLYRGLLLFPFYIMGYYNVKNKFNKIELIFNGLIFLVMVYLYRLFGLLSFLKYEYLTNIWYTNFGIITMIYGVYILSKILVKIFDTLTYDKIYMSFDFKKNENVIYIFMLIHAILNKFDLVNILVGRRYLIIAAIFYLVLVVILTKINKNNNNCLNAEKSLCIKNKKIVNFELFLLIVVFLKTNLFNLNTYLEGNISSINGYLFESELFYPVLFVLPLLFMKKINTKFVYTIFVDIIVTIILVSNEMYYRFSGSFVTVSQIQNLKYSKEIIDVADRIVNPMQIFYFIDFIILLLLFIKKNKYIRKYKVNIKRNILIITLFLYTTFPFLNNWLNNDLFVWSKTKQIVDLKIYGYTINDIKRTLFYSSKAKYNSKEEVINKIDELKKDYNSKYKINTDYNNIAKGKNIVLIQLESMQEFLKNTKINGKEITPNFNKFVDENINLTNLIGQSKTRTADSEFSVATSLYPVQDAMAFQNYYANKYDTVYSILKNDKYETYFLHGNDSSFWNRGAVYTNWNVDNQYYKDKFKFDENKDIINNYIDDEKVFLQSVDILKKSKEKVFMSISSATLHSPYDIKSRQNKITIDVGEYKGTTFGKYLETANYVDYAFGEYIKKLKEEGMYDNTIIIFYGDHYGLSQKDPEMVDFFKKNNIPTNNAYLAYNENRLFAGMRIPSKENIKIDKVVSKIDILPTILQLTGLESDKTLGYTFFGNKDFVCMKDKLIYMQDKIFIDGKWYDINSGKEVQVKDTKYYIDNMTTELDVSDSIVLKNLFK